jgi:hypothetical protein
MDRFALNVKNGAIVSLLSGHELTRLTTIAEITSIQGELGWTRAINKFVDSVSYFESGEVDFYGRRFTICIEYQNLKIRVIKLTWLDGQLTRIINWEDVSEDALRAELKDISTLFTELLGNRPKSTRAFRYVWSFDWGKLAVEGETRSFSCATYISY